MEKKKIRLAAFLLSGALFVVSVTVLIQYFQTGKREQARFASFRETLTESGAAQESIKPQEEEEPIELEGILSAGELRLAWAQNADVTGWLTIPGTGIDYPVMYTPDAPGYYLEHDVDKRYSAGGTPYLDERCDPKEGKALLVYGHHMRNGTIFAGLLSYEKEEYYKEHKYMCLTMEDGIHIYEVAAAFTLDADVDGDFFDFLETASGEEMAASGEDVTALGEDMAALVSDKVSGRALYSCDSRIQEGDSLLLLCTCEYTGKNGRFVVIGVEKAVM